MKTLLAGLYVLFAALLGLTFYVAVRANDGLVEEDYYRKANDYLSLKETEENLGLTIRVPGRLETGRSRLSAKVATANGPLQGARATLRAMRLSGPGQDRTFPLREEAAGTYAAEIEIPSGGKWMLLLAVEGSGVRTERRWIATADGRDAGRAGEDIHAGPVTGRAGGQTVVLDISPKPVAAMRELSFTVELPGYEGSEAPVIDLDMPGMRMPPNRVRLVRDGPGRYRGKGVIVRCRSGKRRWTATVTLPGADRAVFPFDVVS